MLLRRPSLRFVSAVFICATTRCETGCLLPKPGITTIGKNEAEFLSRWKSKATTEYESPTSVSMRNSSTEALVCFTRHWAETLVPGPTMVTVVALWRRVTSTCLASLRDPNSKVQTCWSYGQRRRFNRQTAFNRTDGAHTTVPSEKTRTLALDSPSGASPALHQTNQSNQSHFCFCKSA